jgi:chromosome segregation ATPase
MARRLTSVRLRWGDTSLDEIERLREEGDELEGAIEGLLETIGIYKKRINELQKALTQTQDALERFIVKVEEKTQRIAELEECGGDGVDPDTGGDRCHPLCPYCKRT